MRQTKVEKFTNLVLNVFRVNGLLTAWGDDALAPAKMSSARRQMLAALAQADHPLTASQLAARMDVSRQGVQKQLNLLTDASLVKEFPNPRAKRSPLYAMTPEGQASFDAIDWRWKHHAARSAAMFNGYDLDVAAVVLTALAEVMATNGGEATNREPVRSALESSLLDMTHQKMLLIDLPPIDATMVPKPGLSRARADLLASAVVEQAFMDHSR